MRKLSKLLIAVVLALTLAFSGVLVACNDESEDDTTTAKITDGRWITTHHAYSELAGKPDFSGAVLKLKEDNTFYYYSAWTQHIGTWKINEGDYTYYKIEQGQAPESADEDQTAYKGTQQLELTAHDGNTFTGVIADGKIWNMSREVNGGGTSYDVLTQEPDYEWDADKLEAAIYILNLCDVKDSARALQLAASMTDTGTMYDGIAATPINGTYKATDTGYDLYNGDTRYATVAEKDGEYTYTTLADNTTVTLAETAWTPVATLTDEELVVTLKGDTSTTSVYAELNLWQDGTFSISLENNDTYLAIGTVLEGTFLGTDNGGFTLAFGDNGTTATSAPPDADDNTTVKLTLPAGDILESPAEVILSGEYSYEAKVLYTFSGTGDVTIKMPTGDNKAAGSTLTVKLYDNGMAELTSQLSFGFNTSVADSGTYTVDESKGYPEFTIQFKELGEVKTTASNTTETGADLSFAMTTDAAGLSCTANMGGNDIDISITFTDVTVTYEWVSIKEVATFVAENVTVNGIEGFDPATATVKCVLTSDSKAELVLTISGIGDLAVDSGTWTSSADSATGATLYSVTFTQGKKVTAAVDWDNIPSDASGVYTILTYDASENGVSFDSGAIGMLTLKFKADMTWFFERPAA